MAALLMAGGFAVHQLRFLLAYGSRSSAALAHEGHAYLSFLAPLVAAVLVVAAAEYGAALVRAHVDAGVPRLVRLWALSAATLLVIYCVQELTEGLVSRAHAGGLAGVFAGGGWLSMPLALAVGLVIALLMRGAAAVAAFVAASRERACAWPSLPALGPTTAAEAVGCGLSLSLAAPRAPPPSG